MSRATIIAALITAIGAIIAAAVTAGFTAFHAGESRGQQQAAATATVQQATTIAFVAQQPTQTPIGYSPCIFSMPLMR